MGTKRGSERYYDEEEVIGSGAKHDRKSCPTVAMIEPRNHKLLRSWAQAKELGLEPCRVCKPHPYGPSEAVRRNQVSNDTSSKVPFPMRRLSIILLEGGLRGLMRLFLRLVTCTACLVASLAAGTIHYVVTNLGANEYRYTYIPSGFTFLINQELDIQFDASLYSNLTNGVAGAGFDLVLLQPNNPPGLPGDYSAVALINNPPLDGPFSVDFTYLGSDMPGPQPYFINQYDENGEFLGTLESGTTSLIPESATAGLAGLGLAVMAVAVQLRRRI